MSKGSTFWRQAGLSYLQYLSIASRALRGSLKEPLRSQALARQVIFFNKTSPGQDIKAPVTSFLPK